MRIIAIITMACLIIGGLIIRQEDLQKENEKLIEKIDSLNDIQVYQLEVLNEMKQLIEKQQTNLNWYEYKKTSRKAN